MADRAGLHGRAVSGTAGTPVRTAQETRAAPQGVKRLGVAGGDYYEVFSAGKASPCQPQSMTQGHFSRKMTAGELVYFGRVDQMIGDFAPQNAFRAWIREEEIVT